MQPRFLLRRRSRWFESFHAGLGFRALAGNLILPEVGGLAALYFFEFVELCDLLGQLAPPAFQQIEKDDRADPRRYPILENRPEGLALAGIVQAEFGRFQSLCINITASKIQMSPAIVSRFGRCTRRILQFVERIAALGRPGTPHMGFDQFSRPSVKFPARSIHLALQAASFSSNSLCCCFNPLQMVPQPIRALTPRICSLICPFSSSIRAVSLAISSVFGFKVPCARRTGTASREPG